jgi:prephenate dehydratase
MSTVAYQGEPGAWSEQASLDFFGPSAQPRPFVTFDDVFDAVSQGRCDFGCVPVENSLAGSIHRNYDLLMRHSLRVIGETIVRVRWCLITHPGVALGDLRSVMSHWQALGQTERTLTRMLPSVERKEVYDTAGSVKLLKESGARDAAAIASRRAAQIYDMPVLAEGLEDDPTNYTRFVILARDNSPEHVAPATAAYKTSIVFVVGNVPGSLFKSLAAFSLRDIDLLKIESRPLQGSPWEYLFYLDFAGRAEDAHCARALDHLREFATTVRILGSYPRANMPN